MKNLRFMFFQSLRNKWVDFIALECEKAHGCLRSFEYWNIRIFFSNTGALDVRIFLLKSLCYNFDANILSHLLSRHTILSAFLCHRDQF